MNPFLSPAGKVIASGCMQSQNNKQPLADIVAPSDFARNMFSPLQRDNFMINSPFVPKYSCYGNDNRRPFYKGDGPMSISPPRDLNDTPKRPGDAKNSLCDIKIQGTLLFQNPLKGETPHEKYGDDQMSLVSLGQANTLHDQKNGCDENDESAHFFTPQGENNGLK